MKFISTLIVIILLSLAAGIFFPWWSIAVVAFLVSVVIPQKPGVAFLSGFLALFLLWGGLSFIISSNNHDILAHKVSQIIIKSDNPTMLVLMTALVGALVAGFAALTGSYIRKK